MENNRTIEIAESEFHVGGKTEFGKIVELSGPFCTIENEKFTWAVNSIPNSTNVRLIETEFHN